MTVTVLKFESKIPATISDNRTLYE